MAKREYRKNNKIPTIIISVLLLVAVIAVVGFYFNYKNKNNTDTGNKTVVNADCVVHYIDVGQGDCELIQSDGKNILIDAGENDKGDVVVNYLKKNNIDTLDLVIATHAHSDHIGGLDVVIKNMNVKSVLMPKLPDNMVPTTKTYKDLLKEIQNKNLKITASKVGMSYTFGNGTLTVLGPLKDYEEMNSSSLVCKFTYKNKSFLFTGDMETDAEKDLLNNNTDLKADVLKVGHHGSSTSSSVAFLNAVSPKYAMIEVGDGNSYNHPNKKTVSNIEKRNVQVYRTDYNGTITVKTDGTNLSVETEK